MVKVSKRWHVSSTASQQNRWRFNLASFSVRQHIGHAWRLQRRSLLPRPCGLPSWVLRSAISESAADLLASKVQLAYVPTGSAYRFAIVATLPLRSAEVEKHVAHLPPSIIQKPDAGHAALQISLSFPAGKTLRNSCSAAISDIVFVIGQLRSELIDLDAIVRVCYCLKSATKVVE